jgi:oxaloacetate decarboxylase alpha subunit
MPPPLSAHVSLLAAVNRVPAGLVASAERQLAQLGAPDRLLEVLAEVGRVRDELGRPPTSPPIGLIIMRQAIDHVLSGLRWSGMSDGLRALAVGDWGQTPDEVAPGVRALAEGQPPVEIQPADIEEAREEVGGIAASEEELCLVALFGDEALPLIERLRSRQRATDRREAEPAEEARIRRLVSLLEESGLSELTIEEDGTRITLRKEEEQRIVVPAAAAAPAPAAPAEPVPAPTTVVIESPMVGTFYAAPSPDEPPYVSVGDQVAVGQTLCVLEAMKLFNELKCETDGVVRRVLVANAEPVEYGQPLFELEPALP